VNLETVAFFAVLIAALIGAWFVAKATPKNIDPYPIDDTWSSIGAFYRDRPDRDKEVDFGDGWTSAIDPGAAFELSWISETQELVVLRRQAHPGFVSGGGLVAALPAGLDPRATGMKVLAVLGLDTLRAAHPETLKSSPDGLDRLTERLGRPYVAPNPADPHWVAATAGRPDAPTRHDHEGGAAS
jgi:hypothetical protein